MTQNTNQIKIGGRWNALFMAIVRILGKSIQENICQLDCWTLLLKPWSMGTIKQLIVAMINIITFGKTRW
jgi:hypothetical protein